MNKDDLIKILQDKCDDTSNLYYSITSAKGLITAFASITFAQKNNLQVFFEFSQEIQEANLNLINLSKKYNHLYFNMRLLTQKDAEYFDLVFEKTKKTPVRKEWQTDTQSMGSFVQFNFPK